MQQRNATLPQQQRKHTSQGHQTSTRTPLTCTKMPKIELILKEVKIGLGDGLYRGARESVSLVLIVQPFTDVLNLGG